MQKLLIPFDGSPSAVHAVQYAASVASATAPVQLILLNVQEMAAAVPHVSTADHRPSTVQEEEASRILQPAKQILEQAGVDYQAVVRVGTVASEIADYAKQAGCHALIMGTRGMSAAMNLMIGSTATRVVHLVDVPVTLIK